MHDNIFNTKAIVLHTIKYAETSIIAWLFTEKFGRKSYIFSGVRTKKSKFNRSVFQPLTQLDMVVYNNNRPHLQRVKEANISYHYHSLNSNFVKTTISLFISEILCYTIKEEEPNLELFIFLENSLQYFDNQTEGVANFHIAFLIQLSKYLGFYPINNYNEKNQFFNLRNGEFLPGNDPDFPVSIENSLLLSNLFQVNITSTEKMLLNRKQRWDILEILVTFFKLHLDITHNIKSLNVLKSLYDF